MRSAARLRGALPAPALLFRAVRPTRGVSVGRNSREYGEYLPTEGPGALVERSVFGAAPLRPGPDR